MTLDPHDRAPGLFARMHMPEATPSRRAGRRADFIRPQETRMHPMPDDAIEVRLTRHGERWTAHALSRHINAARGNGILGIAGPNASQVAAHADGPAAALELVGQDLDRREAQRLTRAARGDYGPVITVEDAVKRALAADVAAVVKVLEDTDRRLGTQGAVTTQDVAVRAGFADGPATTLPIEARHEAAVSRARRALEQAARDGVVVRLASPIGELWRLATDDETEEASR